MEITVACRCTAPRSPRDAGGADSTQGLGIATAKGPR